MGGGFSLAFEIAIFASLALGLIILLRDKRIFINRLFFYLSLAIAIWIFTNLIVQRATDPGVALVWYRLTYVTAAPMIYLLYVLSSLFPTRVAYSKVLLILPAIFAVIVAIMSLYPIVIQNVDIANGNFSFSYGSGFIVFIIYAASLILLSIFFLVLQLFKTKAKERQQVKYVLVGIGLGSIFALTTDLILPLLGYDKFANLGSIGSLVLSSATAFAIVKYQLFNIKVLLTEAAVILVLLVTVTQFLSDPQALSFIDLIFLLLLSYGGWILIGSVREEVNRREEIERLAKERIEALQQLEQRNKNLATLQRISQLVLNEIELKPMAQSILDELPKQLQSCQGALLNLHRNGHLVAYAFSQNEFTKKITSLVGEDLERYDFPLKKDFNLLHNALINRESFESNNLSDFVSPPLPRTLSFTIQKLVGIKQVMAVPLTAGEELLGVMMFTYKVSAEELSARDREIARTVADEMSLAIQRALAFQKLKDANEYLSQLDKMKDEFISMASHELNTPLAAIEGYLSMILEENMGKVDAKAKEYLGRAYESSKRLAELIMDLLNVSRIEQGRLKMKFSKVNLVDLADSVIHELQVRSDAKKLYLKVQADKKGLETWCDPDRVREVYVNLVNNAIKFTEKGGVTIKIHKKGDQLISEITDTGRGISKLEQSKLFQKFSQIKRDVDQQQGTGLGLYISKNFVELHNGRIWVESDEGKGATFYFELPVLKVAPKKIEGAELLPSVSAPQVDVGVKDVPAVVINSSR